MAVAAGASAVGLVAEMPSGPGVIDDASIAEIARAVPPPVSRFLLTSRTDARGVIAHAAACGVDTVQLVDAVDLDVYAEVRRALPHLRIVQVLHVEGGHVVEDAVRVAPHVDAILLDSGITSGAVRELGGTGRTHDWAISRRVVEAVAPRPVFLAGGIGEANIGEAVARVRPHGIDLCSSVRSDGRLDEAKVRRLVAALERADRARTE
ncbi:Phosphoribosylanthranilate isomerase [Minicystis rosea]|nr:Phosphoribosylanthranilate isomerase [Minicystis rosea]